MPGFMVGFLAEVGGSLERKPRVVPRLSSMPTHQSQGDWDGGWASVGLGSGTDRDGVNGRKPEGAIVEHPGGKVLGHRVRILVKAADHGIRVPPAQQFDDI